MTELQFVWGWQPALYLFLGGLGAGSFVVAAIMAFADYERNRKTIGTVAVLSFACLAVGLVLLLTELTNPLRGLMMWQSFSNFSSWMAIGAWLLFAGIIAIVLAAFVTFEPLRGISQRIGFVKSSEAVVAKALFAVGGVLSLGIAVYTGVLLMSAPGVPLWNTALLPCLFTVSALDTGVALVELVSLRGAGDTQADHRTHVAMECAVVVLVIVEAALAVMLLQSALAGGVVTAVGNASFAAAAQASAEVLLNGQLAPAFWGCFVGLGLVFPLVAALVGLTGNGISAKVSTAIGACGALVGGCALRFLVLMAGLHANVLVDAVSAVVFH